MRDPAPEEVGRGEQAAHLPATTAGGAERRRHARVRDERRGASTAPRSGCSAQCRRNRRPPRSTARGPGAGGARSPRRGTTAPPVRPRIPTMEARVARWMAPIIATMEAMPPDDAPVPPRARTAASEGTGGQRPWTAAGRRRRTGARATAARGTRARTPTPSASRRSSWTWREAAQLRATRSRREDADGPRAPERGACLFGDDGAATGCAADGCASCAVCDGRAPTVVRDCGAAPGRAHVVLAEVVAPRTRTHRCGPSRTR